MLRGCSDGCAVNGYLVQYRQMNNRTRHSAKAKRLPLPIGNSDWAAVRGGKHCRLGVMTGILRVAKEGVLSGLSNPEVWSVFDDEYTDCFGFTEDSVRELLTTCDHPEKMAEAKAWYDGYLFGGCEIPRRVSQKRLAVLLSVAAKGTRKQIDEKRYAEEMEASGITVLKCGIDFYGRHVALASVQEKIIKERK